MFFESIVMQIIQNYLSLKWQVMETLMMPPTCLVKGKKYIYEIDILL